MLRWATSTIIEVLPIETLLQTPHVPISIDRWTLVARPFDSV
jgi:hypothetical protein